MNYVTPQQMMEEERRAIRRGMTVERLMENAGRAVAEELGRRFQLNGKRVVVFAGSGNNGGDGLVAARYLSEMGASCDVILLCSPDGIKTAEAKENWSRLSGTSVRRHPITTVEELMRYSKSVNEADIVIAAIFGTGVKGNIGEPHASAISMVNQSQGKKIAVDVPSGLDPLTGEVRGVCVKAQLTITLHRAKVGLRGNEEYTGDIVVAPIGIGD